MSDNLGYQYQMFQRDPYVPSVEFNEAAIRGTDRKSLRIGYYVAYDYCEAAPSYKCAVNEAKTALERAGHTVVPFVVPDALEYPDIIYGLLSADGNLRGFLDGW